MKGERTVQKEECTDTSDWTVNGQKEEEEEGTAGTGYASLPAAAPTGGCHTASALHSWYEGLPVVVRRPRTTGPGPCPTVLASGLPAVGQKDWVIQRNTQAASLFNSGFS